MNVDFKELSIPQLREIRNVITAGVPSMSTKYSQDDDDEDGPLCNESPPKGYPEDKGEYGDPECYRYPLNTKKRCLAAWRYVHQDRNKEALGDKWETVRNKIKRYAKEHYDLDLESGSESNINWQKAFKELYESVCSGEGYFESSSGEDMNNEEKINELESELQSTKSELESEKTKVQESTSKIEELSNELQTVVKERDDLKQFKEETEVKEQRMATLKDRKEKLAEIGVEVEEGDEDAWINMSDADFEFALKKLKKVNDGSKDSKSSLKVPPVHDNDNDNDVISQVRENLKGRKKNK